MKVQEKNLDRVEILKMGYAFLSAINDEQGKAVAFSCFRRYLQLNEAFESYQKLCDLSKEDVCNEINSLQDISSVLEYERFLNDIGIIYLDTSIFKNEKDYRSIRFVDRAEVAREAKSILGRR